MKSALIIFCSSFFSFLNAQVVSVVQTFQSPLYKSIRKVCATPDHQTILAADEQGYVFSWRKENGSLSKILRAYDTAIDEAAISSDGKYLATAAAGKGVFIWETASDDRKKEIANASPSLLVFGEAGEDLLLLKNNKVYRSAVKNNSPDKELFAADSKVVSAVLIGNKYLALGTNESITLLALADGHVLSKTQTCSGLSKIIGSGNRLCCLCADGTMQLFELTQETLIARSETKATFPAAPQGVILPKHNNVLFLNAGGKAQLWDWISNQIFAAEGMNELYTALGIEGEYVLTGNTSGQVALYTQPFAQGKKAKAEEKKEQPSLKIPKTLNNREVRVQEPVEVPAAQLDIYVWDDENVDGDTISLNLNGKWILEKYMVTKERKKITVHLEPGSGNYLALYAENLGKAPPNTAVISFNDGNKERTLTLTSDMKRCAAVQFILR